MSNPQDNTLSEDPRRVANRLRDAYTLTEAEQILTELLSKHYLSKEQVLEIIGEDVKIDYAFGVGDDRPDIQNNLKAEQRLRLKEKL